jgi:hypothetical protein
MLGDALSGVIGFLALLGGVALALHLLRQALRIVLTTAEIAAASGMVSAAARRGDLTTMNEGREVMRRVRLRRGWTLGVVAGLLAWIILPLLLGGVAEAYALAAPLWLLRRSGPG